jgi:hypothetical protein
VGAVVEVALVQKHLTVVLVEEGMVKLLPTLVSQHLQEVELGFQGRELMVVVL